MKGIEPSSQAWEARILPLDHTRFLRSTQAIAKPHATRNWGFVSLRGVTIPSLRSSTR